MNLENPQNMRVEAYCLLVSLELEPLPIFVGDANAYICCLFAHLYSRDYNLYLTHYTIDFQVGNIRHQV